MEMDFVTGKLKAQDFHTMSEEELVEFVQRSQAKELAARAILVKLLPAAQAQKLLSGGAISAYEALIKLAKRAPEKLLEVLV